MRGPIAIGAVFLGACGTPTSDLTVEIEGNGTVTITRLGSPAAVLTCMPDCSDEYPDREHLGWSLLATPAIGSDFVVWEDVDPGLEGLGTCVPSDEAFAGTTLSMRASFECRARFAACGTTDPQDLTDDPLGDPSLDLRCLASGIDVDASEQWVRVGTMAAWPPPNVYSWYTTVTLYGANGVIGTYTVELHDGVMSTTGTGEVVAADTGFEPNPVGAFGYAVFFADAVEAIANLTVETGIEKTNNPPDFRMDGPVLESPFDDQPRALPVTAP